MSLSSATGSQILRTSVLGLACMGGLYACKSQVPPLTEASAVGPALDSERPPAPPRWKRPTPYATHVSEGEYVLPPDEVVSLLETESPPTPILHAASGRLALLYEQQLVPLAQATRPSLGLAGLRIDIGNLRRTTAPLYTRFVVQSIGTDAKSKSKTFPRSSGTPKPFVVSPPEGALFGDLHFSPDGEYLAATLVYADRVDLGIYDWSSRTLQPLNIGPLNSVWSSPCSWTSSEELLCSQAEFPEDPPEVQTGPNIQELRQGAAPALAYSNLLRDANDDALFEHYGGISLVRVKIDGEVSEPLAGSGILIHHSLSPDGRYLLTTPLTRPFPRLLPAEKEQLTIVVYELSSGKIAEQIGPKEKVLSGRTLPLGPRQPSWDPTRNATLTYIDRGRNEKGRARDALIMHAAPFHQGRQIIAKNMRRIRDFGWTSEGTLYFNDVGGGARSHEAFILKNGTRRLLRAGNSSSPMDPSSALRVNGDRGLVLERKGRVFFADDQISSRGSRPRLIHFGLEDGAVETLWRSGETEHAEIFAVLDPHRPRYLLQAETPSKPPRFSITGAGPRRAVSARASMYKELSGVRRHLLRYQRADGVMLSAMLYLPKNFRARHPLPTVFWIYPKDFGDDSDASLSTEEPYRYFRVHGPSRLSVLTQGYALLDAPSMPIIGKVNSGSNDFLPQLKLSAAAAIDHLVQLGVTRRDQVAVMGRSYGAFAAANLMTHTDLFATGIALSGAYNRTLTPFGFQSETRTFWQNTEAYVNMSPFFFADQMRGSFLLIHGESDDNPGTPVLQSERFYAALVGNGVRSRYVSFPFEGHQFRGREAVLHTAAEVIDWLDSHLKSTVN